METGARKGSKARLMRRGVGGGDIINYDITGIKNSLRNKLDTTYKGEMYIYKSLSNYYRYTYSSRATHTVLLLIVFFFPFSFFSPFLPVSSLRDNNNNCKADLYESFIVVKNIRSTTYPPNPHISTSVQISKNTHTHTLQRVIKHCLLSLFDCSFLERERESERVRV